MVRPPFRLANETQYYLLIYARRSDKNHSTSSASVEVRRWMRAKHHRLILWPLLDWVRFASLRRLQPLSRLFGFDRGRCVDRYYIENFLNSHCEDIRRHVLEIGDDAYTRRFGCARVTKNDVLHLTEGNPCATIVADLTSADNIPSDEFDCIIFTQTLQFIYDIRTAIRTLYRILKPGGVLLATFPALARSVVTTWSGG